MKSIIELFEKEGYKVKYFDDSKSASEEILKDIKLTETVGIGGSVTVLDMGLYERLTERGNTVYWHWKSEDKKNTLDKAVNTDVYLSSVNAITRDGKIVNMDGTGNRVASMIYGHRDVFLIIGKNKLCDNYEEATERINTVAAPKNAQRLKLSTPCGHTNNCNDCDSPGRMCGAEVILHRVPKGTNITLYLIDEELGY